MSGVAAKNCGTDETVVADDRVGHGSGAGVGVAEGNPSLDEAVARVGDRWTLLIVDALLDGPRRFSELQAGLGLAPNVLTARLRRLEADGLVMAAAYSRRPARYEYRVTAEGRDLAGALRLLARWGARVAGTEVDGPRHRSCGTPLEARWYCPTCDRVTDADDDDVARL
ncbi:MAG TPA: helix-turn-helix domain-containing protein [Acidimicrobiales bacterium]|nr:helix-turn-helix domain-containing protein [Acidimicrobiales bacterium]